MCGILVRGEGPGDPVSESPISYVVNLHDERPKRLLDIDGRQHSGHNHGSSQPPKCSYTHSSPPATQSVLSCGNDPNSLRCHCLNARSIVNKRLQLRAVLESDCLDILVVTETLLTEDSEIIDNTYRIFRRDQNRQGGGVMLLTRSNIPAIQRHDLDSNC